MVGYFGGKIKEIVMDEMNELVDRIIDDAERLQLERVNKQSKRK